MEIKQYVSKYRTAYGRNQKGNKKFSRNNRQLKHDNSKPMGCSKSSSKREADSNTTYLKKQEKCQVDNLTLHLIQLNKEEFKKK